MFTLSMLMFLLMGFGMFFGAIFFIAKKICETLRGCDFVELFKSWWYS